MDSVWVARKYYEDAKAPHFQPEFFNAKHIIGPNIHPVPLQDPSACVTVGTGLWQNKIYHFLPDAPPSSAGNETHTEYFVGYEHFYEALNALYGIRDKF